MSGTCEYSVVHAARNVPATTSRVTTPYGETVNMCEACASAYDRNSK